MFFNKHAAEFEHNSDTQSASKFRDKLEIIIYLISVSYFNENGDAQKEHKLLDILKSSTQVLNETKKANANLFNKFPIWEKFKRSDSVAKNNSETFMHDILTKKDSVFRIIRDLVKIIIVQSEEKNIIIKY